MIVVKLLLRLKKFVVGWWGGLFDFSVKSGQWFVKVLARYGQVIDQVSQARFGQVGYQVSRVQDQVGQGQGQELDNK